MAGGFAAGFGQSFSEAFNQQRQRSHERETDEFRYRMETLVKKKDKYDAAKEEDSKATKLAKEIVQLTGQPPEAIGPARELLLNGANYDDVVKQFTAKRFKPGQANDAPDPVEQQTNAAIPSDTTTPAPAPSGMDGGGFLSKIFPGMKKFNPGSRTDRLEGRVTKTTGMTPEEISQIDQGYTAPDMSTGGAWEDKQVLEETIPKAKIGMDEATRALAADPNNPELQAAAKAATDRYTSVVQGETVKGKVSDVGQAAGSLGTVEVSAIGPDGKRTVMLANSTPDGYTDQGGNPIQDARPRTQQEVVMATNIQKNLGEPAQKYNEKANNLSQAYTAFGNAQKIIEQTPDVLQQRTSGITQYFVDLGKDVEAGMKLVTEALQSPESADPGKLAKVEKDLQAAMSDPALGPAQKLAAARGLLNVQYAIGAYHIAAAKGQDGRNLSEAERKMFSDLPEQATSPAQWNQLIGSVLVPEKQALDKQAQMLPQSDPMYKPFVSIYGYSPVGDLNPMEQYLAGTPGADLDRILPQSGFSAVVTPDEAGPPAETPSTPPEYPGYTYSGRLTKEGKPIYLDESGQQVIME